MVYTVEERLLIDFEKPAGDVEPPEPKKSTPDESNKIEGGKDAETLKTKPVLRTDFPETWIWTDKLTG